MKKFLLLALLLVISITFIGSCQPNTTSKYEVGIVDPQANTDYIFFADVKTDSSSSRLVNNMDYLTPDNVSGLIQTLSNFRTTGDTLIGSFTLPDTEVKRYIKGGLISKDKSNNKYSGMTVTFWYVLDQLQKRPGFFMRKVQ